MMDTTASEPIRVFIAEDNPMLLRGLESGLAAYGFSVESATDGKAMLGLLQSSELPDILLMDVMMPEMSGIDVVRAVRSDPRTVELPTILVTAAPEGLVDTAAMKALGVDIMRKPFRLADLVARIHEKITERSAPGATTQ